MPVRFGVDAVEFRAIAGGDKKALREPFLSERGQYSSDFIRRKPKLLPHIQRCSAVIDSYDSDVDHGVESRLIEIMKSAKEHIHNGQ